MQYPSTQDIILIIIPPAFANIYFLVWIAGVLIYHIVSRGTGYVSWRIVITRRISTRRQGIAVVVRRRRIATSSRVGVCRIGIWRIAHPDMILKDIHAYC